MTTTFSFSSSVSAAFEFATKLMSGRLNHRRDWDSEELAIVEVKFTNEYFTTEIMEELELRLSEYRLSKLEIDDSEIDLDSLWSDSECRKVALSARHRGGKEVRIATFTVHRDYIDGDEVAGWTDWQAKDVCVCIGMTKIELCLHIVDLEDKPLWGTRKAS